MIPEWLNGWQAWLAMGFVLLTAEMLLPGVFLIWFGFAALVTGVVLWMVPSLPWPMQAVLFALLSGAFVLLYRNWKRKYNTEASDQPLLNRRGAQMIGQIHALHTPVENGRGRLKIGDALWSVRGPDLPAGSRVRVVSIKDLVLEVEAVET